MCTEGKGELGAQRRILSNGSLQSGVYPFHCRLDPRQEERYKLFLWFRILTSENDVSDEPVVLRDQLPKCGYVEDDVVHRIVTVQVGVQDEIRGISGLDDEREDRLTDDIVISRVDTFGFGIAGTAKN